MRWLAATAGVAVGIALGRWISRKHAILRLRLRVAAVSSRTLAPTNMRVPVGLLTSYFRNRMRADPEGLVLCDVGVDVASGQISSIDPPGTLTSGARIDGRGSVLTACWTDAHTHLVKTHAHPRCRNPTGSISDALAVECDDQPRWAQCPCCGPVAFNGGTGEEQGAKDEDAACTPCPLHKTDVFRRMDFALQSAYHHGTRAVRTHLDGTNNTEDANLRETVYGAFEMCRKKWGARGLQLQGVANLYLPLWRDAELAKKHVAEAVSHDGVLLGAYCGNVATTPEAETAEALDALFAHAHAHNLQVDLHIDETNDPNCCCMLRLVSSLRRARDAGYVQPVLLGHCTSFALQSEAVRGQVIDGLRALSPLSVICNPSTNLGLQDRRGSAAPHCVPVEAETPRTPIWRGITLIQELAAVGLRVGAASDNVRDWWHPYGDYDALQNWRGAITLAHLDTAPNEGAWAHLVSDSPAAAIGCHPSATPFVADNGASFAKGAVADLVWFPDAKRLSELFSRPEVAERIVLRRGRVQDSRLPSYDEIEDLMSPPTKLKSVGSVVDRGATTAPKKAKAKGFTLSDSTDQHFGKDSDDSD